MELVRDNVKVEWEAIGEGLYGDYNPNNPEDIELLRFYVSVLRDGTWEEKEDGSYCTQLPVSASDEEKLAGLEILLDRFHSALSDDVDISIKKLGEEMSWIGLDSVKDRVDKLRLAEQMQEAPSNIVVKTWCENTKEGEEYLKYNGYRNAKRIGETDLYEVDCIGVPLRDVEIVDNCPHKPLNEQIQFAADIKETISELFSAKDPKMKAVNILWDTDGEDVSLPKEIELPEGMNDMDEISDYLTDMTGFCHFGFEVEQVVAIDKVRDLGGER